MRRRRIRSHIALIAIALAPVVVGVASPGMRAAAYLGGWAAIVAVLIAPLAVRLSCLRSHRAMRYSLYAAILGVVWFGGVDRYLRVWWCQKCYHTLWLEEYRLLGMSIWSSTAECPAPASVQQRKPECAHDFRLVVRARWWGLLLCACPCETTIPTQLVDTREALPRPARPSNEESALLGFGWVTKTSSGSGGRP